MAVAGASLFAAAVQADNLFNTETMYNGSGGASGNSIAVHESNNRFENDALTMSGTGDMRTTSASTGYTGASGTWNVMVNASGENFIIADINSVGYTNMKVFFGIRKNSTSENGSTMAIDASTNGTDWVSCGSISLPTGTGTATWYYRTNAVPDSMAGSSLSLRFQSSSTVEWRIDDVLLTGDAASSSPDIAVSGNGTSIADGDSTPVITDHTDYGAVGVNQSNLVRTFTVTNTGAATLTITNVAVGGANAADFTVTAQPGSFSLDAGAATTFQVRFDPSATGERNAILYITNNVSGKNPFDFYIRGTGVAATISYGPSSINLTTMVGSSPANATFGVTNTGGGRLDYSISTNAAWLSVSPVSAQLAEGASQSETVSFNVSKLSAGVSNATITITDANADNSPQTVSVSVTLTNIPDPTACSATADGKELIDLAWTKRASHDVLIIHREGAAPTDPAPGTTYNLGDAVGSGKVIYKGSGATLEHVAKTNSTHYYRFFSINNNHYSTGITVSVTTDAYGPGEIADQIGYTNGVSLSGLGGGVGWTNNWSDDNPGAYTISSASFTSQTNYPATAANKILVTPPNDVGRQAYRYFNGYTSGKVYAGYMINIQYNGPNKYSGMSFMQGSTEKMFFGEVYGADQKLGIGGTTSGTNLYAGGGNDYIVIARYDFGTDVGSVVAYKIGTDYVPETEPGTWHATYTDSSLTRIDGIRLASGAGSGSGTPGNTYFDEVRVATNWTELLRLVSAPEIAVLGTNAAVIASGDASPSTADGTDFGNVYFFGAASRTNTFSITNSGNAVITISGVTTSSAMGAAADFTVLSWPAAVEPGTKSNLTIRFNPVTLGVRTALVSVANNDADEGNYQFVVAGAGTGVFTTITAQGFEGSTNDGWNYSFSTNKDYVYVDGSTNASGAYALTFVGSDSLNIDPNVVFDNIDVSSYQSVTLQVAFAVAGADASDNLHLDISYDNGATWGGPGSTTLVSGASNTNLGFTGLGSSTVSANPWSVALPSTATQVRVRLRFDESVNANTFDRYFIDDVKLTGAGESPRISFNQLAYWVDETNTTLTVPVTISSAADATVRVALAGTATGGGTDYSVNSTNIVFKSGGSTSSNVVFTLNNDTLSEGIEEIALKLVGAVGAIASGRDVASVLIRDNETMSIMSANLTGGTNVVTGTFTYDETAIRILQRLRPDIIAIQEWKFTNASARAFVDDILGPEYSFYIEPESEGFPIPNGVISRWPIVASNEWADAFVGSRDHVHVKIDIPGPRDLNIVSVHFKSGTTEAAARENEARALTNYIATAGFSTNDFLLIAGDLNLTSRTETTFLVLTQLVTDAKQPHDQAGNINSSLGKTSPFDHVLPDNQLNADHLALNVGGYTYTNGMIFDSAQFADHLLPALVEDSYAENRAHHPVMKLFNVSTAAIPPTVSTTIATATNLTTATSGGNVTSDGGATVTNRGVVWSTSATPTVPGIQSTNGTGTGSFPTTLTNLVPGETYYYRAFAQNSAGTSYGTEYSLTTPCFGAPSGLYASATNDVTFTATWNAVDGADGYAIDVTTNNNFMSGVVTLAAQGFEGGGGDTWGYTQQVGTISTVTTTSRTGATSLRMGSSGEARFGNIPLSGYAGVTVTVAFASVGVDSGEDLFLEMSYNGGSTWPTSVTLIDGFSNAQIDFNETNASNPTTVSPNPYGYGISSSETQVMIRIRATTLGASEYFYVDDISLTAMGGGELVPGYSNRAVSATSLSVTGLTTGVTYYFRVRATNENCISGNSTTATVTTLLIVPDIDVSGNGTLIADGDVTPSVTDHTDFGSVGLIGSNLVRTFTITNDGNATLTLENVAISGTHATNFVVIAQPSLSLVVGASTTFQVRFDPSTTGVHSASVIITNNVTGKNPYNFDIQGTGVAAGIIRNPTSIVVTAMVGSTPTASGFGVTNGGLGQLIYAISTNAGWLTVSPAGATLSETAGQQHTVSFNAVGYPVGTSNAIITITDANASNSPLDVAVQLVLTNIPDPTAQTATADGKELIRLAWTKQPSHDVLIVYREGEVSTDPVQGTAYSLGGSLGGGSIIYKGSGAALEHVVRPGTNHFYRFYSVNNNHYSPGVTASTSTTSYAFGEIVDPIAYTNGVAIGGVNGGAGWSGAWSVGSGTWTAETSSLTVNTNYPDEFANRIRVADPGNGGQPYATRSFATVTSGTIYVSAIVSYQYQGPWKFAGFSLMSNTTERVFVGKVPNSENTRLGVSRSRNSTDIKTSSTTMADFNASTGNVYLVIGAYDFATRDFKAKVYDRTTVVPVLEPGSWDVTTNLPPGHIGQVDGIRLASGALGAPDGTIGQTLYDEVRVAASWSALIGIFPEPEIAVLGTNFAVVADGSVSASTAAGTDFGSTLVSGGQVDRTLFITNSGEGLLQIYGVSTTGTHAADFVVLGFPPTVHPGTVSNFVVRFAPSAAGTRTATLVVTNSDSDEASYDFVVQGTGQVPPTVTTTIATATNTTSATAGGDVTDGGYAAVTNRGVVWSTSAGPTVPGTQSSDGAGTGSFVSSLTGLTPGGTYYYRAFAQNVAGTSYGTEYSLITPCFAGVVTGHYVSVTNDVSFTVVWSNVASATGYALDVSSNSNFEVSSSANLIDEPFAGGTTPPSGWSFTAIGGTYNTVGNYGRGSPSLQMDNTSDRVETPSFANPTGLTIWIKGQGTDASSSLLIESYTGAWATVQSIASLPTTGTFTNMPLNADVTKLRFTYTKSAGNLAFDDVIVSGVSNSAMYVSGYNGRAIAGTSHTVTGLTPGITYFYRVRATNDYCVTGNSTTGSVTTIVLAASIDVLGNNVLIADGDTSPSLADHTDFGDVGVIGTNFVRTFTITNAGPGALTIVNVTTSGAAASEFVVISTPGSPVPVGGTTTFQVRFDPVTNGTRTATLAISNNVAGKTPYDFVVQGTGVTAGISVTPSSLSVTSVVGTAPSAVSFGLTNVGLGNLVFTMSSNVSWLSFTPVRGTNVQGEGSQHTVSFSVNGFGAGASNGLITITGTGVTNSPFTIPVELVLTPIPDVTALTLTNDGNEMVRLGWTRSGSYDVLVTHRQTNAPGAPVQGTSYAINGTIGSDGTRVIYKGSASNLEHVVRAGSINYYAVYSINNNHYAPGVSADTTMGVYGAGEVVETFSYTNATVLAARGGGQGFSGNWLGDTNTFTNILYSFGVQDFYPTNRGNKVLTTPASDKTNIVRRSLGANYGSGVIYVSYIVNFQYNGPDKFSGLSLMSNTTEKLFVGEVGSADERLGLDGTSSSKVMSAGFGNDYIVILRYSWATGTADAKAYKIGTDTVPDTEPATWDATLSKASNVVGTINGIRLASGAGSGTPGETYFDEIRVATSWTDLLRIAPSRVIYDGFASSSGNIDGQGGGTGWSNTWSLGGDPFVNFTSTSIPKDKSSYFEPTGNKIVMYGDVNGRWITASRNFQYPYSTGVVYFSWMQNYEFSGTDKYAGLKLMDGANEKAFIGKVSTASASLGIDTSTDNRTSGAPLSAGTGNDYVIVGKYDFSTRILAAACYQTTSESIAEEPPDYWQVITTQSVGHITSLSGIRFAIGAGASVQIGDVYMDEIRVGTNFYEVARRDGESQAPAMVLGPTPKLLYIGTNYVPATNPQGGVGNITVTDADLANASEPLDIAVQWSDANGVFVTNQNASITNFSSRAGRVSPNWDPAVLSSQQLSSIGYDGLFTNVSGYNGALVVTTYTHRAFNITNSTFNDTYYLTASAEDNNLGGGTFSAYNGGDAIPYWRALTINTALQFFVSDDDPTPPEFFEFTINGEGGFGSTNLTAGAIAIIAVNGAPLTDAERFSFVVLSPFPAGTVVKFTDRGWSPASNTWHRPTEFHTNEWVSIGNASVGQVIELELQDINNAGDQVVVYQYFGAGDADTDPSNVVFLSAVNLDGDGDGWDVDPIPNDNEHSGIYRGLTNGQTAVSVPLGGFRANAYYTGTVVGTASELLAAINNSNNWYVVPTTASTNIIITNYSFTVTGSGTIDWTLPSLSDAQVRQGAYSVTNIVRDELSGILATNASFALAPHFELFNTNSALAVSNVFFTGFTNGSRAIETMIMTSAPPGVYEQISVGTVSSRVYVSDYDFDRANDHFAQYFAMSVFVYDDDVDVPGPGTNLVSLMLGGTGLSTTARIERLAAWNFNDADMTVDHGAGESTNSLSSAMTFAFAGSSINLVSNDVAGVDMAIAGSDNIGRSVWFTVDMTGHENMQVTLAAQRSATGYNSNDVYYAVNGSSWQLFQAGWSPGASYGLHTFDFSSVSALDNATSATFIITFGTNGVTGAGNNRFDNIQISANIQRYYEITDAQLTNVGPSSPLQFSFNAYDGYSGITRGTSVNGTNMIVSVDGLFTNDAAGFSAAMSSASATSAAATSVWAYASAIDYTQRGALFADGQSNRLVTATFGDDDDDRIDDRLWSSNTFFGKFRVIDDDDTPPGLVDISYGVGTVNNRPFYMATNGYSPGSAEFIRGWIERRSGVGSNSVFGVTDEELALSGTRGLEFVFGARDAASGILRGNAGTTNTVMSFSIGTVVTGEFANYQAAMSSAGSGANVLQSNIWTFANGYFSGAMINGLLAASSNAVSVTIPDSDDDRPNDGTALYSQVAGWIRAYDDDISGPTMTLVDVLESPGGSAILSTSFETSQGWPSDTSGYSAGTNWVVTDSYGVWRGSGAFYTTLNNKNTGTRRLGLLVNTNAPSLQWIQIPAVTNPGSLSVYAARFGGADVTIRVERADGASWTNLGERIVTNLESSAFIPYTWDINYLGNAVTLRIVRVGTTGAQVSLDDLSISSSPEWISTNQLTFAWSPASDDYSALDEYRLTIPAVGTATPSGTNDGIQYGAAATSAVQSILGQQGVLTGFIFAVDNDNDRPGDRAMGNIVPIMVRIDTNPPPVATGARASDAANGLLFDPGIDESSEIKVEWTPPGTNEAQAAGWRQSDSAALSPWDSYVVTYWEVANEDGDPLGGSVTTVLERTTGGWSNILHTHTFTNLVLSNLNFDAYYEISIQGRDRAGNLGPATNVIGNTDRFIVTQGVNRVSLDLQVFWKGTEGRDYDVLYHDSTSGFYTGMSNKWSFMQYTNAPVMFDTGSVARVRPGELTNTTYRFYRVARTGRWSTNVNPRIGSVEIYVTKSLDLYPGENWHSLFFIPDTATVSYVFNTNLLPAAETFADATKISWFGASSGGTSNQNGVATAVVWLASSPGSTNWVWHIGGSGYANDKLVPLNEGFLIELPTNAARQSLVLIGLLPTQQMVQAISGGSFESNSIHVLSYSVPSRNYLTNMGFIGSGLVGNINGARADEIRILAGGGNGSLEAPKARIRLRSDQTTWQYYGTPEPGMPSDPRFYIIEPDDAVVVVRRNPGTMYWTNRVTFSAPTKNFLP